MSDRAVIFDKDGTLIHNNRSKKGGHYYILKPEQIEWIDGAPELLELLHEEGYKILVVTMQNWIKTDKDHRLAVDIMEAMLHDPNCYVADYVDDYLICASLYETDESKAECKANAILMWALENDIDLTESMAIGDAISDMMAYRKAGVGLIYQIVLPFGDQASELADKTYRSLLDLVCDAAFNKITGGYLPKESL